MSQPEKEQPLPTIDLSKICRRSAQCKTRVQVEWDWETRFDWILAGEAQLCQQNDRHDGRWRLQAYLVAGVTDFEHDSAYALRLPLVGVTLDSVLYHAMSFTAWIDPNAETDKSSDFRVPPPKYNPMKDPGAHKCKVCKGKNAHVIVPEGMYVPPFDAKLYELVRGKKVNIVLSTVDIK